MDIKAYMFYFVLVTAAIIIKNGKILIAKRKEGKWEFPGGRVEKGEDMEECLKREIKEELDMDIEILKHYMKVEHGEIELHAFIAKSNEKPKPLEHEEIKWIDMEEIDQYNFMEADKKIIEKMVREFDKNLIKVKK